MRSPSLGGSSSNENAVPPLTRLRRSLGGQATRHDLLLGLTSGVAIGLIIWCFYWFAFRGVIDESVLQEKIQEFGVSKHYVLFASFLAVVNSGLEEYYWRWFVFGRLRSRVGISWAVSLSAVAFALHHFVALQGFLASTALALLFSAGIAVGGALWALHYHITGRLWGVWCSHFIVDVAALTVGYHLLS